jgi:uncharacterized protein (DUF1330 family)
MAHGYWVIEFRSVSNQDAVDRYAAIAGPAIRAHGGRVLAGGVPAATFEVGLPLRAALVEFDSVDLAIAAYESAEYQAAVAHLDGAAERDFRVVEGSAWVEADSLARR